jgi:VanZ family protein
MIAAAIGLEILQLVFPTRDPRFFDAIAKVIGCVVGVALAHRMTLVFFERSYRSADIAGNDPL